MDIGRSFTFFLDDPEWIKKVLLTAAISLIPLVGGFMVIGYALSITRETYFGNDSVLPDWSDLGGFLVRGLVAWVGGMLLALPILILFFCLIFGLVLSGESTPAVVAIFILSFGLFVLAMVYAAIILPVPIARYAIRGEFGAMFDFSEIMDEVRRGIGPILILLVIWLVASVVIAPLGLVACFVGVYVTSALSYLIIGHAMGQAYREINRPDPLHQPPAF